MTDSPAKGPGGRPSKYDPAFCDVAIEKMAEGFSIAGLAGHLKVSRQTIYQWATDHAEFSDALNVARAASALWWEEKAVESAKSGDGNASVIIFGLKNRVAAEWRDRHEVDHRSGDGSMTPKPALDMSKLSTDALAEIVAAADGQTDTG